MLGVFDSGIGGLTVVRALRRELPDVDVLYLGDTARFPYGSKTPEALRRYSRENAEWLLAHGASAIVVACHTASSVAADDLRTVLQPRGVPVFDVVGPGLDEALSLTHGHVGIIATRGSVASRAHERYLRAQSPAVQVTAQAAPMLAPLVEEGMLEAPETRSILERYLSPLIDAGIDTLVLGCTHYPPLRPLIEELLPDGVQIVDPADATAARVREQLAHGALRTASGVGSLRVCLTDGSQSAATLGPILLGQPVVAELASTV